MKEPELEQLKQQIFNLLEQVDVEDSVSFIYLYGSYVENPEKARDIDVAVSIDNEELDLEKIEQKINGRTKDKLHVSIFEKLPLQVKNQVFKGELIYRRDKKVYDVALETFRDYDMFKPYLETIIGAEN